MQRQQKRWKTSLLFKMAFRDVRNDLHPYSSSRLSSKIETTTFRSYYSNILSSKDAFTTSLIILESKGSSGDLTSIPWIFLSFLLITIADSGFAYASNTGWAEQTIWVWNPPYIAGYLVMAAGLFWHKHFFIFNAQKVSSQWKEFM